jgi:hypothetical protein
MRCWLTLVLVFLVHGMCQACSCAGGSGPACEEAWKPYTQAVFLGKVTSIHSGFQSMWFGKMPEYSVEIEVEEAYLGISGKTVMVRTPKDGSACGYPFIEGERYIVFASKTALGLSVVLCSRTRPAKNAAEDIAYLRSLPFLQKTAFIQGTLWRYTHDPNFKPNLEPSIMDHYRPREQYYRAMKPVPGATVYVRPKNGKEQKATVSEDGNWQVSGLRPGEYSIRVPLEDRMFLHSFKDKVTIAEKGCAQVDLRVELNGRISGRLSHASPGSDWIAIEVLVLPSETRDIRRSIAEASLKPGDTEFQLAPLPEGKYVLAAYLSKRIDVSPGVTGVRSAAPTFFPGVKEAEKATVITVGAGQKVTNKNFQLLDLEVVN